MAGFKLLVVSVPLLSVVMHIGLYNEDKKLLAHRIFHPHFSRYRSRLLTLRRPDLATGMRGIEKRSQADASVEITEVWPGIDGRLVWRLTACFSAAENALAAEVKVSLFDSRGFTAPAAAEVFVLEDHLVPARDGSCQFERIISLSLQVDKDNSGLGVSISPGGKAGAVAFTYGYPGVIMSKLADTWFRAFGGEIKQDYHSWFLAQRADPKTLAEQKSKAESFADPPLISIVTPIYKTPSDYLKACIESVLAQSYPWWELILVNVSGACTSVNKVLASVSDPRIRVLTAFNRSIAENTNVGIANARGNFVAFLDHDDELEPDALWWFSQEIVADPTVDFLYSDEDRLRDRQYANPAFKTSPNLTKLYTHNYVTHFLCVSRRVLDLTERSEANVSGAQDYDLSLKAFEVARRIVHVPRVLYHWREHVASTAGGDNTKPYAHEAGRRALMGHLRRRGLAAQVKDGPFPYTYRVAFEPVCPAPKLSIIIPSRDHGDLLELCIRSILEKSSYTNYEILIVENGSSSQETFELYELLAKDARVRICVWKEDYLAPGMPVEQGFNYSALINFGVRTSIGDYLLFLNNDTEVIDSAWMEEMLSCFADPRVGVVGAKLLFKDGLVQHAGMSVNAQGDFVHLFRNLADDELGYAYDAGMPREYSMVTGACQMTTRRIFDRLGGYDEHLAVGFNDGDYCLSAAEAGFVTVYQSAARLYHKEFSSRGRESVDTRLQKRLQEEKRYSVAKHPDFFKNGDPFRNPNLDMMSDWPRLKTKNRLSS